MNIVITGCASHLANACLPVFLNDQRLAKITGVDIKPSAFTHPDYQSHVLDIRCNDLAEYFVETDAVVHLAFIDNNGDLGTQRFNRDFIRSVNVAGTQNVFQLAAQQEVKTVIYLSSAIIYGFSAQNPQFMTEDQPLNPIKDFYFAEDKIAIEQWLDEFEQQQAALRVVRLRPHCILGQHTQPLLKILLKQPFHLRFNDPQPLIQGISQIDVASAILQALFSDVHGAFNLATDQVASFYLIQKHLHRYSPPLPFLLARRLHQLAWRYTGSYGDPCWLDGMQYSLTIANDKAKRDLKWSPTLDLFECLEATV